MSPLTILFQFSDGTLTYLMEHVLVLLMRCQRKGAQILITSQNIFSTFVKLSDDKASDYTFILYDGHKSHISLTLSDWARERNLTIFDLPHHSSH